MDFNKVSDKYETIATITYNQCNSSYIVQQVVLKAIRIHRPWTEEVSYKNTYAMGPVIMLWNIIYYEELVLLWRLQRWRKLYINSLVRAFSNSQRSHCSQFCRWLLSFKNSYLRVLMFPTLGDLQSMSTIYIHNRRRKIEIIQIVDHLWRIEL